MAEVLEAPHELFFPYTRSTGPLVGAFLTGLREGRLQGVRGSDGRVLVPPQEFDPVTAEALTDLVEVAPVGEVVSWAWNPTPREGQPLDRPFAWAQVRFDGADTTMLHALDVASPDEVATGMRVRVRWAGHRAGAMTDIAALEPAPDGQPGPVPPVATDGEPVTVTDAPIRLRYRYTPGAVQEAFLRGTQQRRLLGRRCATCGKVYLPPRGACSMCGSDFTDEQVECGPKGTVATFAIVNVNFANRKVDLPYVAAEVLMDGADTTTQFLLPDVPHDQVRMGMRVQAVWTEDEELEPTLSNVTHVEPIDEPDAPFETIAEHS